MSKKLNRREFIGVTAAGSAFTILPRRILGGPGFVAPSDKINVALIGSGTMGINMLQSDWLPNENIMVTSIADPNKDSSDYRDWSPNGFRDRIRRFTGNESWDDGGTGIRAGRDVGKMMVDGYYAKSTGSDYDVKTYVDFRELIEAESDLDAVLVMTPEHLHGCISTMSMNKGLAAISHKTLANTHHEVQVTCDTAKETGMVSHLMAWADSVAIHQLRAAFEAGIIGTVREIHNWSNRPIWPQGWLDLLEEQPVPEGMDWDLWLGPIPDLPYNLNYTHALFRGWRAFGSGGMGDMGNYSLWRAYRMLDLGPITWVEGRASTDSQVDGNHSRWRKTEVAFPKASTMRFRHASVGDGPARDVFWYDGGIVPPTPEGMMDAGEQMPREGMMFVGDNGTIIADFHGSRPRLVGAKDNRALDSFISIKEEDLVSGTEEWVTAFKEGKMSRADFADVRPLAEATCLGNIAVQLGAGLKWDANGNQFVGNDEANKLLTREYRPGWEM